MRRNYHRHCQGRFTRLASLARSLTVPAAAGLLLVIAVPLVIMPMPAQAQGNAQSATYRVTFEGKFTASALASGVSVPSGEHFTTLIGAVHNGSVTFWSSGGTASAGIESMAEVGGTSTLKSEINANSNALAIIEQSIASGGTATATVDITLTTDHPLVTLTSMIAPSPDWFVGVSGLSLRNTADDGWQPSLAEDLFPYDAGTEEGTEFSLSNSATSPQGTIASIKGTGKFSNEPIATLVFDLLAAPVITTTSPILVPENETAVATLTASDDDTPIADLTWTIPSGADGGADADHFTLSEGGILAFSAAKDYEAPDDADADGTYEVTVQVSDGTETDSADLVVTLENVVELTTFSGPTMVTFAENGATRVATFSYSSDEDRDGIQWLTGGVDRGLFSLDSPSGALRFLQAPDFENPLDVGPPGRGTNNSYELKLVAWARDSGPIFTDEVDVKVTVTDVDEAGALSLSATRPALGAVLTAVLTDPDGVTAGTALWQWERSTGRNAWAVIDGAAAASYTPVAADTNTFLRVTATYADEHGTGKTVSEVAPNVVTGPLLTGLTAETDDSQADTARGLYPAFDPLTLHYGIGCNSTDTLVLTVSAAANARVGVAGVQAASAPMAVDVSEDSDVAIRVTDASGAGTTYVVHCLPEVFFDIETHTFPNTDAFEDLILFNLEDYFRLMDRNGVPRLHLGFAGAGTFASRFHRVGADGAYRYGFRAESPGYIILDEDFEVVAADVRTVAPLTRLNTHDFQILEDGNYLLMSYEPAMRDFSDIDLPYLDGADVSSVDVRDAAFQIVTPGGHAVFTWNSWDNMAIEDCVQHRFPVTLSTDPDMRSPEGGYAHINGMHVVDGVLVASMRGCSKVLGIDVKPGVTRGDVLWRMGRTNLSDAEWAARDIGPRPLDFINDPEGEFCGQHTARFLPNGNIFLFDNGVVCAIDPWTFEELGREGYDFSRAVEYALDLDNHEAVFVRDHSLRGERSHLGYATGNVDVLDNGDWLVSWGRVLAGDDRFPDNEMATLVDPATGQEKLGLRFRELPSNERQRRISATVAPAEALAPQPEPLTALLPSSSHTSVFHTGSGDAPQVIVAFNQPVVDFSASSPSLSVTGATVASVSLHVVAGEPANAYVVVLTPAGTSDITFGLVADQPCADGGICTADGTLLSEVPASHVIRADTTPPAVSNIEVSSDPGTDRTYAVDDEIQVTVTFSETVAVTGMPELRLELGGGQRTATYEGGSGTAALVFGYTVAAGESDTDGVGVEADSLSGGTIRDGAGHNAVLDHQAVAANASHKVDGVKPELAASGGEAVNGTTLTLTYDEPLDGSSTPASGDFTLSGGDRVRTVTAVRVNGSAVELTLDVGAEHGEAGIQVSYTPGDNPIQDVPGNDAEALSRESVTNDTPDTTSPEVSSLAITSNPGGDQIYAVEDEIEVTVTFSETVEVEGTPQLRLRVGTRTRTAGYDSGTGTAALVFAYEVADGDEDNTDGVSIEAGRIALNGGTIEDEAENAAELVHEAVAPQAGHKVDGVRPAFVSAAVDGSSLTLTYREALDPGSRPAPGDFTVQVDGSGRTVSGVSVSDTVVTLTLNPAVEHGDTGIRVSYTPGTNPLRDAVGNDVLGLSSQSVTNTTDAPNTAPEITSPSLFDVPENQMLVRRLAARDTDPGDEVTGWDIVGGADQGQFTITSDTGDLSFRTAPDYEAPGDNEYEVTVEVRSGAGARELEAEQMFTLRVTDEREPPGIPEAPTFSGETAESMTINWSEPDNTGPAISDYDVQYREKGTGRFIDGQHEGPGFSLTLDDLEPGTVYEVQVRATNDEGTSNWSEPGEGMTVTPLTVQMTPDLPPPVEGAFTVRFSFSETVRGFTLADIATQQEPPCMDSANNPVACNPTIAALQTTDDRIFTTTVTPRTEQVANNYTLTITVPPNTATSVVGNKPNEAAALDVRIAPPGVTVPISSVGLRASSGNGQVTLRWNAPANSGGAAIVRYEYRWGESGGEFGDWMRVAPSARSATVPNLTNGTEYVFELRGVNALGYGAVETAMATPEEGGVIIFPPPPPPPVASNFPTADAGPDQTGVREGTLVMLDGSGSSDPDDDPLRFRWNQLSGQSVVLSSQNVVNPTFTAPEGLTADEVLSFRLLVTDPSGQFDSDTVTITVEQGSSLPLTEDQIYYFPHLAVGAGWQSTITYINYSPQEVSCQTEFISDDGAPLMLSFAGLGTVVSRTDILLPGGSVHQETNVELSVPLAPGWARATCSGPVKASLLFRQHNSAGLPVAEAAVNAATVPATRFVTFAEQGAGKSGTGVAYANPSDTAAMLTFTARDEAGLTLASVVRTLLPGGHDAQNMEGLFDLTSFAGSLEITSTEPIVTLSLNFEAAPVFSSLPPGEVDAAAQGATTYYFPHLAVGASWQTTITYINYSPQEVSCQTEFLSDQGSPLMVSFAGMGTVISRPDVLPPGGSVHQETNVELSAPLAPGWARASCTGPVKASLLFRQHNSAGVPVAEAAVNAAAVPATRFVTFAEQGAGKAGTGVAYANPSDTAALVTFTARDADGETLASVDKPLLPNGHDAQNMMDLFGLSSFTGSLEVASTAPIVSLSLNFEAAPVFSSLPSGEVDAAAQGQLLHDEPQIVEVARQPVHAVHHHHIALARQDRQLKGDGNRHLPTGWKGHP